MDTKQRIEEQEAMKPCKLGHHRRFLNVQTGACDECQRINEARGRRKAYDKREWQPASESGYFKVRKDFNPAEFEKYLRRLADDPVALAQVQADMRRPKGVTRARHGVALRKNVREPMLTATPGAVRKALKDFGSRGDRVARGEVYTRIIVKPTSSVTGVRGWYERRWVIYNLRYSSGVVVVTDEGQESRVFGSYGEARKAIIGSGWVILRVSK
jgi:hypothetical protein